MHHTAVHPRYLHGKRGRRDPAPTNNFPKTTTIILTTVRNFGSSSGIIVDGYNTIYFPFEVSNLEQQQQRVYCKENALDSPLHFLVQM